MSDRNVPDPDNLCILWVMDAKNIFICCQRYSYRVEWIRSGNTEWQYIGVGPDYNESRAADLVNSWFKSPTVFVVVDRRNAYPVTLTEVPALVGTLLPAGDVTICETDFSAMIVFDRIGVVKKGRRQVH